MPTTANTINYYVAADGTLRDGQSGSIAQTPRIYYGTEYSVTLTFPPSTIAEGDQLQVALNRTRTFFSSASATGDAPVAAVAKHDVTSEEAAAQAVTLTLSTNTRAMIDQVNGIDHPVRGFFGVHVLRGQSFITLAVADALMVSLESGPDAISPSLPVVDYPTREEAEALTDRSEAAAGRAETAQGKAEEAQGKAETAEDNAQIWAEGTDQQVEELGGEHSAKEYDRLAGASATNAEQSATNAGQSATDAGNAKTAAQTAQGAAETAQGNAAKIAEGSDADVEPLGLEHSAKGWAQEAAATLASKRDILQTLVTSSATSLEVEAGKSYNWTVSAASTISMKAADKVANKETRIDIYIDLQSGGSVTGDGVVVADAVLQSGWYKLIWDGTTATLYSTKAGGAASVITIPAATTAYTLEDNKHYQQVPSAVPTYTLPAVTFDGLVHEITVLVDFMHVTSCSFVDASNVPVTLQSAISPQIGEAYIFRCYWYGKWRVVPLKIRNAATASSATGVLEVSDAVAGDALALRMTAPQSVVVNQWFKPKPNSISQTINGVTIVDNGDGTYTVNTDSGGATQDVQVILYDLNDESLHIIQNHVYLLTGAPSGSSREGYYIKDLYTGWDIFDGSARKKQYNTSNNAKWYPTIFVKAGTVISTPVKFSPQRVDLTQYFNGDTALIDSIQTWDDLVAYDPRFASYVAYNAGEVVGVTPTVKVTGKNLFDAENAPYLGKNGTITYTKSQGTIVGTNANGSTNALSFALFPITGDMVGHKIQASGLLNGVAIDNNLVQLYFAFYKNNVSQYSDAHASYTITDTDVGMLLALRLRTGAWSSSSDVYTWSNLQVEWGETATAYEPYHDGGTATASSALYGVGTARDTEDAVTGERVANVGSYTFTGNETWIWDTTGHWYYVASSINATGNYNWITSNGIKVTLVNHRVVRVYPSANPQITSETNMNNVFSSGVMLYYERNTPTTSAVTPTTLALQAGSNTAMQTDGGRTLAELSMTYENLPAAD